MKKVKSQFEESGLTLEELGKRMGYPESSARKSAWQFIHRTVDPRLSMLLKFTKAIGISIEELVAEEKENKE